MLSKNDSEISLNTQINEFFRQKKTNVILYLFLLVKLISCQHIFIKHNFFLQCKKTIRSETKTPDKNIILYLAGFFYDLLFYQCYILIRTMHLMVNRYNIEFCKIIRFQMIRNIFSDIQQIFSFKLHIERILQNPLIPLTC